jgi:hypothetical protein
MLKKYITIPAILVSTSIVAQRVVDVNKDNVNAAALVYGVGGEPFSSYKYVKVVEGSPYFKEEWLRGSLISKDSNEYTNLRLRLDLVANTVEYIDKSGQQMVATAPVRELRLVDSLTGKSHEFVHSSTLGVDNVTTGWYQRLVSGKIALYKRTVKQIQESRPYSSATIDQKITVNEQYFLQKGSYFTRIKKFKDLPDLLSDKRTLITKTSSDNKLNGKSDQDYIDIFLAYNQQQ